MAGKTLAHLAAIALGVAYLVAGVVGFFYTGFSGVTESNGPKVIGLLSVNPFHNVVHLAIGAGLLLAGLKATSVVTEGLLLGVGSIYVVAAICGFIYAHIPVISDVSSGAPDNYLHAISGITAILAAVASASLSKPAGGTTPAGAIAR
ncbi:MAG TPA: DUF4383 domain-containing protein [Solirubrobacteraceae bacterium]|jgi:hypothetical protein|nr:DUF4383 domain-containing protein [Solirubrobacteraceae bacterium]